MRFRTYEGIQAFLDLGAPGSPILIILPIGPLAIPLPAATDRRVLVVNSRHHWQPSGAPPPSILGAARERACAPTYPQQTACATSCLRHRSQGWLLSPGKRITFAFELTSYFSVIWLRECPPPDNPVKTRERRQEQKYFNKCIGLCLYICPESTNINR